MSGQWSVVRLTADGTPRRTFAIIVFLAWAAVPLWVGLHHEPWRDEADAWLVVRDAPLSTLFTWTRNAGTPSLWYLLQKPLVWAGLPYRSQFALHLALAWAAGALLLFRAPFPLPVKLLTLGSYYFVYEYAVVARSYVLTILLSFLAATWYSDRYSRPLRYAAAVALLFNANVHGAIMAAVLTLLFIAERRRATPIAGASLMLLGALLAWLQLRPAPDAPFPQVVRYVQPTAPWLAIGTAFAPGIPLTVAGTVGVALLVMVVLSLRRRRDALLLLVLSTTALCALYALVVFGGYRHSGLILVVTLVALWIARDTPRDAISAAAALVLNATLLLSAVFAFRMSAADVRMAFSGSREIGEFIRRNGYDRFEIAAHPLYSAEAILPWIPEKRLWYPSVGHYRTYANWNAEEEKGLRMTQPQAIARAVEHFAPRGEPWLILLNQPIAEPEPWFRLVYTNQVPVYRHRDERYWLYAWTGGRPPPGPDQSPTR